ncbi:glycosyltransferase family 2 protein [Rothia kristinae]|uniref:glycosyltransferase family 2 protein n=1 Tax=Rothia kristinae TaxID=37923 RepID=UPI001C92C70A|nr:galactosyltransferase-related protein [Rothia kristinae]
MSGSCTAVLTLASVDRMPRVRRQHEALRRYHAERLAEGSLIHVLALLGDAPREAPGEARDRSWLVVPVPEGLAGGQAHLARARNLAAAAGREAGADLLVFLDADCLPGPRLLQRCEAAAVAHPRALLAGPVTYLDPEQSRWDLERIAAAPHPHPARPDPPDGEVLLMRAGREERAAWDLFWSLSFAVRPEVFDRIGGFFEGYTGYGGEDTDFAYRAYRAGVNLAWVGGAHAFHQHHPVSSPPVEHLADILVNARLFRERWGVWPMRGWLEAFAERGLARWDPERGWLPTS